MDILAHSLWAAAGAKAGNTILKKKNRRLMSVGWAAFWGVFPDFFAFGPSFCIGVWALITTGTFMRPHLMTTVMIGGMSLPEYLYQFSHSLVVWAAVFVVAWILSKRPRWELFGWALHILIDIPSHSAGFYATPFLFPLLEYRFPFGVQWSNRWYMIINYSLLLAIYGLFPLTTRFWRKNSPSAANTL